MPQREVPPSVAGQGRPEEAAPGTRPRRRPRPRSQRGAADAPQANAHRAADCSMGILFKGRFEYAAEGNVPKLRAALDRAKGEVDPVNPEGETPLHVACGNGRVDCAKLLLDCGAAVNEVTNPNTKHKQKLQIVNCP